MYILRNNWNILFTILIISLLFFLAYENFAHGQPKEQQWYFPDCFSAQTGGYIGFIAIGVGFLSSNNIWESTVFYGYCPANVTGKVIHTISWKNILYPFTFDFSYNNLIKPLYLGVTMFYVMDKNVYWEESTNCPDRYYNPTGRHIALSVGIQMEGRSKMMELKHGFYIEITMLDTYMKAYLWDDNDYLNFEDCASMAIGYKIIFN
ncbi:MAG: hypothetical protein N3F66_13860 [Spirochaetes bacterium]|jgi:hypothetical protein|nr:hypothetical protein [Spirochaetota bacterium]